MGHEDEVRMLREQMTALQWALSSTLASCQAIAEQANVDDALLIRLQSLKEAVQNLESSPGLETIRKAESAVTRQP